MKKRIVCIVLALCMVIAMAPAHITMAATLNSHGVYDSEDENNEETSAGSENEYDTGYLPEENENDPEDPWGGNNEDDGESNENNEDGENNSEDGEEDDDGEPDFDDEVLVEVGANDSLEIATELESGVTFYGAIADEEDIDFYQFNMQEAGYFSFTFNNIDSSKSKWKITILDYAGEKMTSFTTSSKKQIYETQNFNFGTGEKSTVYVQVEYVNRLDDMYTITVNAEEDDTWEQEPDNSYTKAFKVKKGITYSGNLFSKNDKDYFLYKPTANRTASVRFSVDEQDEDIENGWNIYVYNSAKKLVKSAKNVKNDRSIGFKVKKNCKYYIIIKPASKTKAPVGVDYELTIK